MKPIKVIERLNEDNQAFDRESFKRKMGIRSLVIKTTDKNIPSCTEEISLELKSAYKKFRSFVSKFPNVNIDMNSINISDRRISLYIYNIHENGWKTNGIIIAYLYNNNYYELRLDYRFFLVDVVCDTEKCLINSNEHKHGKQKEFLDRAKSIGFSFRDNEWEPCLVCQGDSIDSIITNFKKLFNIIEDLNNEYSGSVSKEEEKH